jgi:hypothetical protein
MVRSANCRAPGRRKTLKRLPDNTQNKALGGLVHKSIRRQLFVFGFLPRTASMCASSASSMYCDKLRLRSPATTGMHPANEAATIAPPITDELHAMLLKRADDLEGLPRGLG